MMKADDDFLNSIKVSTVKYQAQSIQSDIVSSISPLRNKKRKCQTQTPKKAQAQDPNSSSLTRFSSSIRLFFIFLNKIKA